MIKFLTITLVFLFLAGCSHSGQEVQISDLATNPEEFLNEDVSITGKVTESLGETTHFLLYPYPVVRPCRIGNQQTVCTTVSISVSQVRVAVFEFSDMEYTVLVSEKTGGIYAPIPFVPAGSTDLPVGEISLNGKWVKDKEGKYYLHIHDVETLPTPTAPQN
jgi:hypothetical protein